MKQFYLVTLSILTAFLLGVFSLPSNADAESTSPNPTPVVQPVEAVAPAEPLAAPGLIGPVTTLPAGYTLVPGPDGSTMGKPGGFDLFFSNLNVDRYTALYWGPQSTTAVMHALSGSFNPQRVLSFDQLSTNFAGGIGYWNGSSPSIYSASEVPTRFTLQTSQTSGGAPIPLVAANSVGIAATDVVIAVPGDFRANLLFETNAYGAYQPSNWLFDNFRMKDWTLDGSILSSFDGSFWYTAPDTSIQQSLAPGPICLGGTAQIMVTVANAGPGPVTDVVVRDVLPPGMIYLSDNAPLCGSSSCYDPLTGYWTVGTLTEGQQSTLTITGRLDLLGYLVNVATRTQHQVDPNAANDQASLPIVPNLCAYLPLLQK